MTPEDREKTIQAAGSRLAQRMFDAVLAAPAEPKPVEITDEMVQEAQAVYVDVLCNLGERDSTAMRAALEAALSEARTEGGESQ